VVLLKLLAPLEKRKGGKWISVFIQLIFLWFYATLTGLCPSVLRSVTMLSVVVAGRAFNKNAHILNSLAASALILLFTNPLMLFDIGFQLSYLAVAGIVILQPQLEKIWEPKFWATQQLWTLISVTLVAQVFTFPLGLYYFKQFPTYFLLSNLVVIPLSTLTMYAGLMLLVVSPFAIIAKPIAVLFGFLVELLNASVTEIEHLPCSVIHSTKWEKSEMLFLYIFIISILVFLLRKNKMWLQTGLASFLLLLACITYGKTESLQKRELIFFNVNHSTAIAVVNGNDHVLFADTSLLKHTGDIDFHIDPFLRANGMTDEKISPLEDSVFDASDFVHGGKNRMTALGKKIIIAGRNFSANQTNEPCDILLMHGNSNAKLDTLISRMNPSLVVVDGSDGKWKIKKWAAICAKRKVKFYDVNNSGALIIEK
jgi:competence protein ComEC